MRIEKKEGYDLRRTGIYSPSSPGLYDWKDEFRFIMDGIATGIVDKKMYLFPVDPGLGKTTLVAAPYIKICKKERFKKGAIIVFVSRISEIETYINSSCLAWKDYAVYVSKEKAAYNKMGLGWEKANEAPVLFTTQQMFASRIGDGLLADAKEFHFRGKARPLRIWDESFLPADPVSINVDILSGLPKTIRAKAPALTKAITDWLRDVNSTPARSAVTVPSGFKRLIAEAYCSDVRAALGADQSKALNGLSLLAGSEAELFETGSNWLWLVGCGPRFPPDMAPMAILDASGSVRGTYELWKRNNTDLVILPPVRSSYSDLKIAIYNRSSGKMASKGEKDRKEIAKIASDQISRDNDDWLIIHHKDDDADAILNQIKASVPRSERIASIHWGDHHGFNDLRLIEKVMVLGLQTYPTATYRAMHMASAGRGVLGLDHAECRQLQRTEMKHHLLQAISRCSVRNHVAGVCGKATVYMIAASSTDPIAVAKETFPGASVREWCPPSVPLTGRARDLVFAIENLLIDSGGAPIQKKQVRKRIGLPQSHLARLLKRADVQAYLDDKGILVRTREFYR